MVPCSGTYLLSVTTINKVLLNISTASRNGLKNKEEAKKSKTKSSILNNVMNNGVDILWPFILMERVPDESTLNGIFLQRMGRKLREKEWKKAVKACNVNIFVDGLTLARAKCYQNRSVSASIAWCVFRVLFFPPKKVKMMLVLLLLLLGNYSRW